MKKIIVFAMAALMGLSLRTNQNLKPVFAETVDLPVSAASAILIEPLSGRVIFEKNADTKLYPASMTKMMGMYLVLQAVESGKFNWTDMVTASDYASSMGGTQIYLEPGEQMSVEDMFKAVAINSANDAITALGEHISGSTPAFVKLMNDTAKKLNMTNTNFKNPTGFDDDEHVTTARDMGLVASKLVNYGEDLFRFTRLKEAYVRENTSNPFWLVNTNRMLGAYEGMDGLKTGFTNKAGFNLTATAKRNGVRLISVVMKEADTKLRAADTSAILNLGFSKLKALEVFRHSTVISTANFTNSLTKDVPLVLKKDAVIIVGKDVTLDQLKAEMTLDVEDAPIEENQRVGTLIITTPDGYEFEFDLYAQTAVKKANFFDYLISIIMQFLS